MWLFNSGITLMDVIMRILAVLIIVFLVLPLHECAHGWVAYKLGDPTAKMAGRLTLNPLVHFDPLGALGILLFSFGWARPVPVDASNFKNPRRDMAITAAAGPISNLLAAILGGLLANLFGLFSFGAASVWISTFFSYYIVLNIGIAVFNLIPLAPLDGFRIAESFIPERFIISYYRHYNIITLLVFLLLFLGVLTIPLVFLENIIYSFVIWLTALPFAFFA